MRNLGRFSALTLIGGVFMFLGKLFVASATGIIGYVLITNIATINSQLNSPILPTVVLFNIKIGNDFRRLGYRSHIYGNLWNGDRYFLTLLLM